MEKRTKLTILTPEGIFFDDYIDILTIKIATGYRGIQKNVLPFVSNIEISTLFINRKDSESYKILAIGGGLVYAEREYINIFTDDVVYKENIEESTIRKLIKELEKSLEDQKSSRNIRIQQELALKRSLNKINTLKQN